MSSNSQLCTCVLEVALALTQQLLEVKEDDGDLTSRSDEVRYAVGESVMARRMDGDFGEGTVLDSLDDGMFLVMWHEEEVAAKLSGSELMPFGSGMGLSTERRQRVAPAFILNNFLTKTAIPSNDLSRVQMVVRDGADVNCTDGDGSSPLNLAVSHGASVALIQFLISRGAHVNFVGSSGSALQIAAIQDNVEVVRCLLAHGADPALVDLDAAADDAASVLRETLRESEQTPSASQRLLSEEEEEKAAAECFTCLLPALLSALSGAQSPKLHKRVLMVLSYVVQRASREQLDRLSPQQLGQLLSALRSLLAAPTALSQFVALRMLVAGLEASAQLLGPNARRHGVDLVLQEIIGKAAGGDGSGSADGGGDDDGGVDEAATAALAVHSSRAQAISLKPEDVVTLATRASSLLRAVPVSASESSVMLALRQLPAEGRASFGKAAAKLAALLLSEHAPSAHELQQSGTVPWLLDELANALPAELRQRWADFERAFGGGCWRGGRRGARAAARAAARLARCHRGTPRALVRVERRRRALAEVPRRAPADLPPPAASARWRRQRRRRRGCAYGAEAVHRRARARGTAPAAHSAHFAGRGLRVRGLLHAAARVRRRGARAAQRPAARCPRLLVGRAVLAAGRCLTGWLATRAGAPLPASHCGWLSSGDAAAAAAAHARVRRP